MSAPEVSRSGESDTSWQRRPKRVHHSPSGKPSLTAAPWRGRPAGKNTIQSARSRRLGRTGPKLPEGRYLSRSRPQQRKHGLHQIHRDGPTSKRTLSLTNIRRALFIDSSSPAPEAEDIFHWIVHLLGLARDPCTGFSTLPLPLVTSPFSPPFIFSIQVSFLSPCMLTHTFGLSLRAPLHRLAIRLARPLTRHSTARASPYGLSA